MRCPLCDGHVLNGRCQNCGMPYKKDEFLYHLNENRQAHEKYVSEKVKKEIPERKVHKEEVPKRKGTSENVMPQDKKRKNKKKKKSRIQWLFCILVIFILIAPLLENIETMWKIDRIDNYKSNDTQEIDAEIDAEIDESIHENKKFLSSWTDSDGNIEIGLNAGYGPICVGSDIDPGDYEIYTNEEMITLVYENGSEVETYALEPEDRIELSLKDGDVIYLDEYQESYESVYLVKKN